MCLDTVDKKTKTATEGFKTGMLRKAFITGTLEKRLAVGEWIEDDAVGRISGASRMYRKGFHVWKSEGDARGEKWCMESLVKVEIDPKSIVASGRQHGANVIVARRIKILGKV